MVKPIKLTQPAAKAMLISLAHRAGMKLEILGSDTSFIFLRLISESFKDFKLDKRQTILRNFFNVHAQRIVHHYTLVYEAYTPDELKEL